jgi:hypothetical protein
LPSISFSLLRLNQSIRNLWDLIYCGLALCNS